MCLVSYPGTFSLFSASSDFLVSAESCFPSSQTSAFWSVYTTFRLMNN